MTKDQTSLRSILLKENLLNGPNYIDWYRKLKIVLKSERKFYVLTDPKPNGLGDDATEEEIAAYEKFNYDALDVECLMLSAITPELQKQNARLDAQAIDEHLKELFV